MPETTPEQRRFVAKMEDRAGRPIVYANHAMVDVSPFEAIISFGLMDAASALQTPTAEEEDTVVEAATVARIALPHRVFVALSEAMLQLIEERPEIRDGTGKSEV